MFKVHVRILSKQTLYEAPIIDGTTQKQLEFEILRPDNGWLYKHVMTDGSRLLDERIDKLMAYGGVSLTVRGYQGDDASPEWKEQVVRAALVEADGISWSAACAKECEHASAQVLRSGS